MSEARLMRVEMSLMALILTVAAWPGDAPAGDSPPPPGARIEVRAADMPPPNATPSVSNSPRVIARGRRLPEVPAGFSVNVFAEDLHHVRWLAVAPDGAVFLAEPRAGHVLRLEDANGDGRAERRRVFADGLELPHGLAIDGDDLLIADVEGIWRKPWRNDDGPLQRVTGEGAFGKLGGHWTRNIAVAPDGKRYYVAIGSAGNISEEPLPRASVQVFARDGSGQETFASGLRNPVGIAFRPGSKDLYVVVNERDGMGEELVPDYLTKIEAGDFYGWPYAYIGSNPQPGFAELRPDLVAKSKVPDLLIRSHSAPLGLAFYDGTQFPPDYKGDAFVALHGSWNAAEPRGYMVVRVPFEEGRPLGHYEVFMSGFWVSGDGRAEVFGRPVGLAVAADGSLLVADDAADVIWRVSFAN